MVRHRPKGPIDADSRRPIRNPCPFRDQVGSGIVTPPDREAVEGSASPNRILFWMCVLVAINQLGFGGVMPALPLYAQSFGVSVTAIGMAVAVWRDSPAQSRPRGCPTTGADGRRWHWEAW